MGALSQAIDRVKRTMKMTRSVLFIFFMLFLKYTLLAQNEGNIWYFGNNAGIDFNSGTAIAIADGKIRTSEGCASICDVSGKLLFYTDGSTIWNAKHEIMPNGTDLLGNRSTTQSAIIVKMPGSSSKYFVFTVDDKIGPDGLCYSVVDMSLQGGLGDVNLSKNVSVVSATSERITAVKHRNGTDFWIITHIGRTNILHAYLLTANGLRSKPVISDVGEVPTYFAGYLKASKNGNRIAMAFHGAKENFGLFDFNNSTGVVSNRMIFDIIEYPDASSYGIEFSPNGNLLYVACLNGGGSPSVLYQYNLLAGTQAHIDSSKINLGGNRFSGRALQLAPDGKIYAANYKQNYLGVIEKPNILGVGCAYQDKGFMLASNTTCQFGLPTFFSSIFQLPNFTFSHLCYGDSTAFRNTLLTPFDSVLWYFDDLGSINNSSNDTTPIHIFSDTGTYKVSLTIYLQGDSQSTVLPLTIKSNPRIFLGNDTIICPNDTLLLEVSVPDAQYIWQDSSENHSFQVTQPGEYWVSLNTRCGTAADTINVALDSTVTVNLGNDTVLCLNSELILKVSDSAMTYKWHDGSVNQTFKAYKSGVYWVKVNNRCGESTDTIILNFVDCMHFPNAFTPNNDAINDTFSPVFDRGIDEYNFMVFNRWGQKIFETNNPTAGWDGTFGGQDSPIGVYVYVLAYRFSNMKMAIKYESGYFTLIR